MSKNENNIETNNKFQQPEPAELDEATLQNITGGRLPETKYTYCGGDGCYKPNPY